MTEAAMTIEQLVSYCERELARLRLNGDAEQLRRLQLALAVMMQAAESVQDRATALQFRVLAAHAADARELKLASEDE
jgi:hypothetical protein